MSRIQPTSDVITPWWQRPRLLGEVQRRVESRRDYETRADLELRPLREAIFEAAQAGYTADAIADAADLDRSDVIQIYTDHQMKS